MVTFTEEILNGKLHFLCSVLLLNLHAKIPEIFSILGCLLKVVFLRNVILNLSNLDLRSRRGRLQIKWWRQHWMCRKVPNVRWWSWSTRWIGSRINPAKSWRYFNPTMPSVNKMVKQAKNLEGNAARFLACVWLFCEH